MRKEQLESVRSGVAGPPVGAEVNRCIAAFVLLMAMPVVAGAGEARASFLVSASVAPRVTLDTVAQPGALKVSEEDVARGYVDVAAVYHVQNNDPAGYLVQLSPLIGLARAIEVSGLASGVVMGSESVEVLQPAALEPRELTLKMRVVLASGVPPGVYPIPLHVSATTL